MVTKSAYRPQTQPEHSKSKVTEEPSWSSPSASPSPPPPPPPIPRPVTARWARTEQNSADSCPQCRGRLASLPTRTTSLSSYSGCKERSTLRPPEDEDSFPVICERELHSLHRNIPALRRRDVDTATIKQHYYPEGGWGWLVCGAAFLAHLLTTGFQLAFGLLYLYTVKYLIRKNQDKDFYIMATDMFPVRDKRFNCKISSCMSHMQPVITTRRVTKSTYTTYPFVAAWLGALCLCISFLTAPMVVAICRRKSTRLAAAFGGILTALACLFTSFAVQFHQALLSYGLLMGLGTGIVKETSGLVLGHYFKRRREFVEMVAQTGVGVGIALFSVLYKEAVGKLGWRLGLQSITGLLSLAFFLPIVYRSATLYHPQRQAITHLKNQRKKMKEKKTHSQTRKPPMFDFTPLKSHGLRILMLACAFAALGIYGPIFYLVYEGYKEGLEDSALVLLQTFMGFASALGCVGFGLITAKPSSQCLISRQYLCQAAMVGIGVSLLALSAVQGYHGYVLFVWLYGTCLGGYTYSLKMFALERIRGRHFNKAWSFIQGAKSVPVLLGVPMTGYINHSYPKAGYYFSFVTTIFGASLMFFVGTRKDHANNSISNCNINNLNECACNLAVNFNNCYIADMQPYKFHRQGSNYYEKFLNYSYMDQVEHQRHALRRSLQSMNCYLPKSYSYAANIDKSPQQQPLHYYEYMRMPNNTPHKSILRPSKSVPEGLAQREYCNLYIRRPTFRNVQVIEQITTSV